MTARQAELEAMIQRNTKVTLNSKSTEQSKTSISGKEDLKLRVSKRDNRTLNLQQQQQVALSSQGQASSTRARSNKRSSQLNVQNTQKPGIDFYGKSMKQGGGPLASDLAERYNEMMNLMQQNGNDQQLQGSRFYNTQGFSAGMLKDLANQDEDMEDDEGLEDQESAAIDSNRVTRQPQKVLNQSGSNIYAYDQQA